MKDELLKVMEVYGMYGYIYKTTNKITNQIYVGKKKVHPKHTIHPNYYGSGKLIKKALAKYGKSNFSVEVIDWCETKEMHSERERYWVKTLKSLYTQGNYNMAKGGIGGSSVGQANNLSGSNTNTYGENNPFYGRKHSQKTKDRISKSKKGSVPPNKGKKYTENEKEKIYYNKTFKITCYRCSNEFISHASGSKYCDKCTIKRAIDKELKGIIRLLNGYGKCKSYYIARRVDKILKLESMKDVKM